MPKNRILYNCQGIYIGPSPSSGYHFIDVDGNLNNTTEYSTGNFNLIKKITRATNLNYNIVLPREEIKQIGKSTIAAHPIINTPNIEVGFEYHINGVLNEARLGFNVNHTLITGVNSGQSLYNDNFNIFIFSGLDIYNQNVQPNIEPYWPGTNRASKNIYATITKEENKDEIIFNDINFNPKTNESNTIAFGDGYLLNYRNSCSVGNLPKCAVTFICDNVVFYTGTSGLGIPSINQKNGENLSGIKFVIPNEPDIQDLPIIRPGDILIDIQQTGVSNTEMNNITDLGVKFSDIKLQNYSISIQFEREDLNSIGYKAPSSRRINFPVRSEIKLTSIVGDEAYSNLRDLIKNDKRYNFTIRMRNNLNTEDILRYDFRNAYLEDFSYASSIEENRTLDLSFRTYSSPDDLSQGFFISGQIPNQSLRIPY